MFEKLCVVFSDLDVQVSPVLEHPVVWGELDGVERQEEGRTQSSQFLAASFNNGLFCIRVNPYGSEQFDLGCAFQTSFKFVEYAWAWTFQVPFQTTLSQKLG